MNGSDYETIMWIMRKKYFYWDFQFSLYNFPLISIIKLPIYFHIARMTTMNNKL